MSAAETDKAPVFSPAGVPELPRQTKPRFLGARFWVGLVIGGVGALLLVVGGLFWAWHSMMSSLPERLAQMQEAPPVPAAVSVSYDWELVSLADEPIDVDALRGKVLFVNVWATWCPPCVAELPSIDALYRRMAGRGIEFLCMSAEELGTLVDFTRDRDLSLPFVKVRGQVPAEFTAHAIPATFVVDRDGQIVLQHLGGARWDDERVVDWLTELLMRPEP